MFNIEGSELIFLVLIALIVLGPEKLPDAIRKAGRAYAEFKKMANGFQGELKQALDEPMRELRDTADAMRAAANFDLSSDDAPSTPAPATPEAPVQREPGLNFGSANPRKSQPAPVDDAAPSAAEPEAQREPGLNFGSANPRRRETETTETATTETATADAAPASAEAAEAPAAPAPPVKKERPPGGTPVPRRRPVPAADTPPDETAPESAPEVEDASE